MERHLLELFICVCFVKPFRFTIIIHYSNYSRHRTNQVISEFSIILVPTQLVTWWNDIVSNNSKNAIGWQISWELYTDINENKSLKNHKTSTETSLKTVANTQFTSLLLNQKFRDLGNNILANQPTNQPTGTLHACLNWRSTRRAHSSQVTSQGAVCCTLTILLVILTLHGREQADSW